ncbi:MAG TPA: nuclear transport factor 2 family protein [Gaiellaceae bacterium]|nr:nuclear transport factor 2 family protein [Gaiellaceae bacterium]
MSVEDVEIVRRWREVLVDDDTEAAAALLAADLEWVVVSGESLRGIEEVRKYYAGSGSGGPENLDVEFDPGELEDLGDGHVSALNHQIYRWKETGELAHERWARIEYTIREGRIVRYEAKLLEE